MLIHLLNCGPTLQSWSKGSKNLNVTNTPATFCISPVKSFSQCRLPSAGSRNAKTPFPNLSVSALESRINFPFIAELTTLESCFYLHHFTLTRSVDTRVVFVVDFILVNLCLSTIVRPWVCQAFSQTYSFFASLHHFTHSGEALDIVRAGLFIFIFSL